MIVSVCHTCGEIKDVGYLVLSILYIDVENFVTVNNRQSLS